VAQDCGKTEMNARNLAFERLYVLLSLGEKNTQYASLDDTCQQTPKTTTDKCEEDSSDIHSTVDSTSTLNSNDAADTKRDYLVIDASGETVSGRPKEITPMQIQ